MDWKNILERAIWTFVEGFLVAIPSLTSLELDGVLWKSILLSGIMGGISALKTFIIELIKNKTNKKRGENDEGI